VKTIILGNEEYTPSKIICVGKNYPDHVVEMGGRAMPETPAIFIKPNSALAFGMKVIDIPKKLGLLHHEVELCFVAGNGGRSIEGYAVGLDLTLRDMQEEAKKSGLPWTLAKGFDYSAPLGLFTPAQSVADPCNLDISLRVNGEVRQHSNTREMIFKPGDLLSYVSGYMTVEEGDVFMCGTPGGVGAVDDGDRLIAEVSGLHLLQIKVRRR